ncbi:mxaK protein [Methylophilaceae bacterium]|nr:mxaK protein [Methylophilaceae bacterium]
MARRLKLFPLAMMVFFVSLFALIRTGYELNQAFVYNQKLQAGKLHGNDSADAVFADAIYWGKRGDMQKALALYAQAASADNPVIRKSAYYNSANLYLREASSLLDEKGLEAWDQASALLSMAKESYREALRLEPGWHEAKYNYELALRLSPIFEGKSSVKKNEEDELETGEFIEGWPSIPGFPRGMP